MTDRTHPDSGRIITSGDVIAELQDRIAELEAELEAIGAGGVQALSAAPAIKPLVWSDESGPTDKIRYNHITAETALGQFSVEWKGWKEEDWPCVYLAGDYIGVASDLGGAKMLAEQHIRELVENLLAASPTPPTEQQATKETSGGFHVWRDISTAPKDGSRFVAIGYNYGLYSEGRHICVAQWFRGFWMETSDWNEASELKHLTHWLPLPSPPDNAAELNDLDVSVSPQQAAPKAAPAWEHHARKLTRWLHCMSHNDSYFGEPAGLVKQVTGELNRLIGAAPQQEAQEPCQTCTAMARTAMMDQVSFDRKPDCYAIRQITDDEGVEEWEDIRTSPDVAREEANNMMATRRGEVYEVVPLWTTPQPAPAPLSAREIEMLDGMIDAQLNHAQRCDSIPNRPMAEKQKGWDMERVTLLRKLKATMGGQQA